MSLTADAALGSTITYEEIYAEATTELRATTAKLETSVTKQNILERAKGSLERNLQMMSNEDMIAKSTAVVGSVVGAVSKFESGNALECVSGALDIATAVLDFAPPPFSLISGN